jgi:alpha-L-fucosidase
MAVGGEFANIKNDPLWQTKSFEPQKARYVKLQATQNTQENDGAGYGELDVKTR